MTATLLVLTLAFPVPKTAAFDFTGTVWVGTNTWSEGQRELLTLTFQAGGTIIYANGIGASHYRGTWTQEGSSVTWTVNDHATFTAKVDGNILEGNGSNKDNNKATVKFERGKDP